MSSLTPVEPVVRQSIPTPPGYVFVPKGNLYITGNCRRHTQANHQTVYVVVNQDKKMVGIRVPAAIYNTVLAAEASTRQDRAAVVHKKDVALEREFSEAVLKLFPQTPSESIPQIVARAMQKRSGRVGRTGKLDVDVKATLAVRAHIRHVHTEYDAMLRKGAKQRKARDQALDKINEVAKAWGGHVVQKSRNKTSAKKGTGNAPRGKAKTATKFMTKTVAINTVKTTTKNAGPVQTSRPRGTPGNRFGENSKKVGQSPRDRRCQKMKVRQKRCDVAAPSPTKAITGRSVRDMYYTDDDESEYEAPESDSEDPDWTP